MRRHHTRTIMGLVAIAAFAVMAFGNAGTWHAVTDAAHRLGVAAGDAVVPAAQAAPANPSIAVGFSPGDAEVLVVRAINGAHRSIEMAAYSFTSRPIATALVRAHDRGVKVRIVADSEQRTARYSKVRFVKKKGIPVRLDNHYAIMHNKFMVIDGTTVETGSFNYTRSAAVRNAENVIVLHNLPTVADTYAHEWARLWGESRPLQ